MSLSIPYLNTLPKYSLFFYITELYPILKNCRSIFSHCIKSKQYPRALKLTADVISSPRRNIYPRRPWKKTQEKILEKVSQRQKFSHGAEKTLFHTLLHCEALPYLYTLSKTLSLHIAETIPYLNTLPKLYPILTHCRNYTVSIAKTIPYPLPKHTLS